MSRDLRIDVNVNPNGVASPTQTRVTETPEATSIQNRTVGNAAVVGAISSVAQRGIRIAAANIGELTGSRTLQRNIQATSRIATLGTTALINPLAAGVLAATQLATFSISQAIENRNLESDIRYQQQLRGATHNNGRRR
jgi:hypothetical protein